jgi:hypothetical protein
MGYQLGGLWSYWQEPADFETSCAGRAQVVRSMSASVSQSLQSQQDRCISVACLPVSSGAIGAWGGVDAVMVTAR